MIEFHPAQHIWKGLRRLIALLNSAADIGTVGVKYESL
jgi:hypothetical protein